MRLSEALEKLSLSSPTELLRSPGSQDSLSGREPSPVLDYEEASFKPSGP
jgi:hypothetical protein